MSRAAINRAFPARKALLVTCLAAMLPVSIKSPELLGAPPPFAEQPAHYYEIAQLSFVKADDRIFRAQEISTIVTGKTRCEAENYSFEVLIHKKDPAMEIIYIRAVNTTMIIRTHWGDVEDTELNRYACSNTSISQCLWMYHKEIAGDIVHHDECFHQGGKTCSTGSH